MSSAAESAIKSDRPTGIRVNRRRYLADNPRVQLIRGPFTEPVAPIQASGRARACWNEGESTVSGVQLGEFLKEAMGDYAKRAARSDYEEYRQRAILWRGATKKLPLSEMTDPRYLEARVCHLDPSAFVLTRSSPMTRTEFWFAHECTGDSIEDDRRYARYCESWAHAEWFFGRTDGEREYLVVYSRKAGVRYFKPGDPDPDPSFFLRLKQVIFDICRNSPKG